MADLNLDPTQLDRYSRHIIMNDVGPAGQKRLLDSKVLIIGAGGLGAPIIQYLAAAGVGTLGIVDDDTVERSNLQRQIIHADADVGRKKVESAREYVADLNPDITVRAIDERVTVETVDRLIEGYDFVIDGTDNFQTRFLINDACTLSGTPFTHGAVFRFDGQVTTFDGTDGPCYRCLFPEAPPDGTVPDCAEAGVLGILPGTIGCLQATEAVKGLLGMGESLVGRMLYYDALEMRFDEIDIKANPDCPVCGDEPAIDSVSEVDYSETCTIA
ncbi:MAG: molybdopterin-synthase adenylyltransferase MoeB [Halobacteriales archaeon]